MGVTAGLAGRRRELRAVTDVLTGQADVAAMLVAGEAGIGKSRLVAAASALATQADVIVSSGWCLQLSGGLPFLPVVDVLRGLGEVDDGRLLKSALSDCPAFVRGEIVRLVPELEEPGEPRPIESDDGWRRQRLLDALRRLVRAAGQLRQLAVVIEDVHWSDGTTLELLDYLFAPGHATGVPVVITCRSEEASLTGWLDRLQRNTRVRRIDLAPLTGSETAEQIGLLIGERPTQAFSEATYQRSEGNAFFTEQLVSSAAGQPNAALPTGLTALLLSRTAQVTSAARQVLGVLAVASRPLDEPALAHVCARAELEVREALRDLLARRLLRRPDGAGRYPLRHALLAEAICSELLPGERRELHAKVADMMSGWNDRAVAAQIAEHLAAADRPGDELRWRVIAGAEAETVYATKEAAGHWRRAITLWDEVPDAAAVAGVDLAELYRRAATSTESAGDEATAAALAEQALGRLASTAGPETAVRLYRTVGMYRGIESVEAGLAALATAVQIGERLAPSAEYVKALRHYGHLLDAQGRFDEERAALAKALRAAQEIEDPAEQKILLLEVAWLALAAGDGGDALAGVERSSQIVIEPADPVFETTVAVVHTDLLLKTGELDSAVEVGLLDLARADASGQSDWFGMQMLRSNVCEALTELGDVDRAAGIIDPVTGGTPRWDSCNVYLARADLDMRHGRLAEAAEFWDANADLVAAQFDKAELHHVCGLRLEVGLWQGEPGATLPEALPVLEGLVGTDTVSLAAELFVLLLRVCSDVADNARANADGARLRDAAREGARLFDLRAAAKADPFAQRPLPVTGPAHGLSWRAEWTRLRGESDAVAWEQTAAVWDELTRPHRAAYARWRQAEALLATPQGRTPATAILRSAARQAAQHMPLSKAIHDLARRARIELIEPEASPPAEMPAPTTAFGLTERELAVIQLLGQGKTNTQIGATLFISTKTASVHVSNILRKLDVATRVQAATVAERAGLLRS